MSIKGYSTELKAVKSGKVPSSERFSTISGVGYRKYASDVSPKSYYELTPNIQTAGAYDSSKGELTLVGHTARPGDMIRVMDIGIYNRFEVEVLAVDGDSIIIDPRILDGQVITTFKILRAVSNLTGPDGEVSVSSGPVKFVLDSLQENVTEDTVDPNLNTPLPTKMFIQKDGVILPINKDTGFPVNTVAMPVEIVGVSGTEINITAGDINVQTTHLGPNADSTRIGDGTTELGMTLSGEAKVNDAELNTVMGKTTDALQDDETLSGSMVALTKGVLKSVKGLALPGGLALETTLQDVKTAVEAIELKDFATEVTLDALATTDFATEATLASIDGKDFATEATLSSIDGKDFATETTLGTLAAKDFATETTLASIDGKDFATETTLASIDGKDFATETTLGTLAAKDFATETTLSSIEGKDFATNAEQLLQTAALVDIKTAVETIPATFIPAEYDEVAMTYNGAGDIGTVVYKMATVTIATLTLGYTNGNLTSVVKS